MRQVIRSHPWWTAIVVTVALIVVFDLLFVWGGTGSGSGGGGPVPMSSTEGGP